MVCTSTPHPTTDVQGIDEIDVHVESAPNLSNKQSANVTAAALHQQGLLAACVPGEQKPANDYDPAWFPAAHPSTFPHNKGACPKGLSLTQYAKILLTRYPREQFAQNVALIAGK